MTGVSNIYLHMYNRVLSQLDIIPIYLLFAHLSTFELHVLKGVIRQSYKERGEEVAGLARKNILKEMHMLLRLVDQEVKRRDNI